MEEKPKRKYTRKPKTEKVEKVEKVERPKRKYTRKTKVVEEPLIEEIEDLCISKPESESEPEPEPVKTPEEVMAEIFVRGYPKVDLYIYYEGCDIDDLLYIKEFQKYTDKIGIATQVVICTKEQYERVGINNCFHTEDTPNNWTDICLSRERFCALRIDERPRMSPEEIIDLVTRIPKYKDDFIEYYELE